MYTYKKYKDWHCEQVIEFKMMKQISKRES